MLTSFFHSVNMLEGNPEGELHMDVKTYRPS